MTQQPFIRNHQFNLIKKQADWLQRTTSTVSDVKVVAAARESVYLRIAETFPEASPPQLEILERVTACRTAEDFKRYLDALDPLRASFGPLAETQLRKLYPKVKKLKAPDLSAIDWRTVTYLGWTDVAANRLFLVYALNGRLVGIEGRCTPASKKGVCFACNRQEETALFSAVTKHRPAGASPDYFKSVGNYICINSETCNRNISDVAALEKFVRDVSGIADLT